MAQSQIINNNNNDNNNDDDDNDNNNKMFVHLPPASIQAQSHDDEK